MSSGNEENLIMGVFDPISIVNELVAAVLFAILVFIIRNISYRYERTERGRKHVIFITILRHIFYWLAAIALCLYYIGHFPDYGMHVLGVMIASLFVVYLIKLYKLTKFRQAGIENIDLKIKQGVDYKKSLEMCRSGLEFLGVGASKLTELEEFKEACHRCHDNRKPIKLLLSTPNNPLILKAAKAANENEQAFSNKVRQSLLKIKQLRDDHSFNIEVRFYPEEHEKDLQQFRLMFLNEVLCLASYTAWGKRNEDGSGLPQLNIRHDLSRNSYESFYYPFKQHFDRLWEVSKIWNFNEYID